ncbi:MAG: hypothetical protein M3Q81_01315 [bacterium]|nr:hypothetical protein [bacterium]
MPNQKNLTVEILQTITKASLNQNVWQVTDSIGSSFKLEVGTKVEKERGEFHFWIYSAHWWLQQGKNKEFNDIVNSESNPEKIKTEIKILKGQKILHIEYNKELAATIFDFENDLFLRIAPYGFDSTRKQWQLFTPTEIFSVNSNGTYSTQDLNK